MFLVVIQEIKCYSARISAVLSFIKHIINISKNLLRELLKSSGNHGDNQELSNLWIERFEQTLRRKQTITDPLVCSIMQLVRFRKMVT